MGRLPDVAFSLESEVYSFARDANTGNSFIDAYFAYTHPPMPFLSKRIIMERVLNPLGQAKPSNTLLVACMRLVANRPRECDPRTPIYQTIKDALHRAESAGLLDLRIFQAWILVALYELGHGIYPAAYLTLGYCVRYGYALGINKAIDNDPREMNNTLESEEKRRGWWAVILLDRSVFPFSDPSFSAHCQ